MDKTAIIMTELFQQITLRDLSILCVDFAVQDVGVAMARVGRNVVPRRTPSAVRQFVRSQGNDVLTFVGHSGAGYAAT